jgi:uncharacterized DUF497 family protein
MTAAQFEWDDNKDADNQAKHRKVIRIIGAGYWRKGKAIYEKEDRLHG